MELPMKKIIFTVLVLFSARFLIETAAINPGIELIIPETFFDESKNELLAFASKKLQSLDIPDINYDKTVLWLLNFKADFKNFRIKSVELDKNQTYLDFKSGNMISAFVTGAKISIEFDYLIQPINFLSFSDAGSLTIDDLKIYIAFDVLSQDSRLQFNLNELNTSIENLEINLGSSLLKRFLGWIMGHITEDLLLFFNKRIDNNLKSIFEEGVSKLNADFPKDLSITKADMGLDISLVSSPSIIMDKFLSIQFNGAFHSINQTAPILNPNQTFPVDTASNDAQAFIHKDSIHSLLYHLVDSHLINAFVSTTTLKQLLITLDTRALDGIFPGLKDIYPAKDIALHVVSDNRYDPIVELRNDSKTSRGMMGMKVNLTFHLHVGDEVSLDNLYLESNATFHIDFEFIKLNAGLTLQVTNMELVDMFVQDQDKDKIVIPKAISEFSPFMKIAKNQINQISYEKVLLYPKSNYFLIQSKDIIVFKDFVCLKINMSPAKGIFHK